MICHKCESENVELSVIDSPVIINQLEIIATCRDCGADHEHSLDGGDLDLVEPSEHGSQEETGGGSSATGHRSDLDDPLGR